MERYGFAPTRNDPFFVEFMKRYADDSGRLAQALVHFDRAQKDMPPRLARFHAIVQAAIDPEEDAIRERAPVVMQEDLLALARVLRADVLPDAVVLRHCTICRRSVSEFFVVEGRLVCRTCR
jgi:hypothetical protein